ncbi:hypothetical protein CFC21_044957 [Triticum aestivum]|uniref:F-box domain-containing protein n=2 Tax=Triticum aestivum TaxID=4565 RepID=A0A9R1FTI7_WHEAT|nr:MEIOTIC F-BOX protein MOF-like [Triticum aestivum]KAF7033887.1 hypothetical protein CFC21_044957 [Triticum aestivum]CDM87102.1 unnamed protein product [Triticum aestivum]
MLGPGRSTSTDASAKPKRPHLADGDGGGGEADNDRLSALPDDLLHEMLSRLNALETVGTCVLSARWRHLWRAAPCLDIDEREFTAKQPFFVNFTGNLLRGHEVALLEDLRVYLRCGVLGWSAPWVRRAIGLGEASPCRLKRLHLSHVSSLQPTELASHVSSRCPALEDLKLQECGFLATGYIRIVSSSLKKLVLDGNYDEDGADEFFIFIIDAPALVSLLLGTSYDVDTIVAPNEPHTMPSLVDASIQLSIGDGLATTAYQSGLLAALYNATSLHLLHFGVTLLCRQDYLEFPVLKNLRTLSLDECHISDDFMGLEPYLRKSRNLEKLTLRRCKVLDSRSKKKMGGYLHDPSEDLVDFKCENLKLSEIIYQDGDASIHLLVKFLEGMWRNLPNNKIKLTKVD